MCLWVYSSESIFVRLHKLGTMKNNKSICIPSDMQKYISSIFSIIKLTSAFAGNTLVILDWYFGHVYFCQNLRLFFSTELMHLHFYIKVDCNENIRWHRRRNAVLHWFVLCPFENRIIAKKLLLSKSFDTFDAPLHEN